MPTITPYRLTFPNGLHIGTRGVNLEEAGQAFPADTLFAALVDAWQRLTGDGQGLADAFTGDSSKPPFLITSAFPFAGQLLFFPVPVDISRLFKTETLQARGKQLKRIQYFSLGLLQKALQGFKLDDDLFPENNWEEPTRGAAFQGGALWFLLDEIQQLPETIRQIPPGRRHAWMLKPIWETQRLPRVTVGRINSASNLFHAGKTHFAEGCGLWFGVDWRIPDAPLGIGWTVQGAFDQALQMLQDDGLGGERSTGYGTFHLSTSDQLTVGVLPKTDELAYLLSRYNPKEAEILLALDANKGIAYRLESVSGWLRSPSGAAQRRKRVYFLCEGSLIRQPAQNPSGQVVNIAPDYENNGVQPIAGVSHPVYRYGLAFSLAWPDRDPRS